MRNEPAGAWVVYSFPMRGSSDVMRAVCDQGEWEVLDRAKPGFYTLVRAGIVNEGEAERLARGTSGAARPRTSKVGMTAWPGETAPALVPAEAPAVG